MNDNNTDNLGLFRSRFKQAISDSSTLPAAGDEEKKRSHTLTELITMRINEHGGSIPFSSFMDTALYEPGLGYYAANNKIFGAAGDFLTAPEISDLFGICIAHQCVQVLSEIGPGNILEIGAGSGVLAATILNELANKKSLPGKYYILERSENLRNKQAQFIKKMAAPYADCVEWITDLPEDFKGIIVANELLDALPVTRFICSDKQYYELNVASNPGGFNWVQGEPVPFVHERLHELELPDGYVSELNLAAETYVKDITACIKQGVALFFDYGYPRAEYYLPDRNDGTLMCYYRHRTHSNPFILTGLQDITSFIDFTAMAESAVSAGADVMGYTSQAGFLMAMGLDQIMAEKSDPEEDVKQHLQMTQAIKKLTLPHEMGELIKVMAIGKNFEQPLLGFLLQDRRHRL